MNKGNQKHEIISFKADRSLLDALAGISNRSEFIRSAVLAALESVCPVCKGSGILTPNQQRHWDAFKADHELAKCGDCHEFHMVCRSRPHEPGVHRGKGR